MADPQERDPRAIAGRIPAWVALPAAAVLIAIVALASRSISSAPGSLEIDFAPILTTVQVIGYVGIAVGIGALVLGSALWRGRMRRLRPDLLRAPRVLAPVPWWMNVLAVVVLVGMLVFEVVVVMAYINELRRLAAGAGPGGADDGFGLGPFFAPPGRDLTALTVAVVIVAGLAVLLVALAIRVRLSDDRRAEAGVGGPAASTVAAVEMSLGAIRSEPDPRRAVIAAYAEMERSLSSAGFGRRRSEAPLEYLRRVLAAPTRAAEEVRTITLLFQHAKFSRHAVDESMRDRAIAALERIRATAAAGAPS